MKEASEFAIDWLVENPKTGYLVSGPSISPENSFLIPGDGEKASMVMGPTMDHMMAKIISNLGNPLRLSYNGKIIELKTTDKGKSYLFTADKF